MAPLLVRPAGGFLFGGGVSPNGSQINHIDNLKSRKNMSGLHSKCRGGGVSLAYPRTSHIFILFVNIADTLPPAAGNQTPRTHTKPREHMPAPAPV